MLYNVKCLHYRYICGGVYTPHLVIPLLGELCKACRLQAFACDRGSHEKAADHACTFAHLSALSLKILRAIAVTAAGV